jgi:hypothetical protein
MARPNFRGHNRPWGLMLDGGGGGSQVFKMFGKTCDDEQCPVYKSCLLPYTITL